MRRLFLALFLLVGVASADTYTFTPLHIAEGYVGPSH